MSCARHEVQKDWGGEVGTALTTQSSHCSPSKTSPPSLHLGDAERAAACQRLRMKTQFELPLCDHAMRNAGDDEAKAEEWLRGLGWQKEYR